MRPHDLGDGILVSRGMAGGGAVTEERFTVATPFARCADGSSAAHCLDSHCDL